MMFATTSAQAEFFDNAFANAAKPPAVGGGAKWVITAKVSLNGTNLEYITARGTVTLQPDGMLAGDLPLSINGSAAADNALRINIRKSNPAVVVVTRMIAGKPFLGRRPVLVSLPVNPNFNYLSGPIQWTDGSRVIRIDLESEYVRKQTTGNGAANTGGNSGGSGKPIGARYQIGGFMRVTNSSDGPGDNTVELYGALYLHHYRKGQEVGSAQTLIKLIEQDANNGFQLNFNNNVYVDAFDGDNDTLTLEGSFRDRDKGQGLSGDDDLFIGSTCLNDFGLYNLYRISLRDGGSMLCKGDQNSESADVRIFAKKVSDLYKR